MNYIFVVFYLLVGVICVSGNVQASTSTMVTPENNACIAGYDNIHFDHCEVFFERNERTSPASSDVTDKTLLTGVPCLESVIVSEGCNPDSIKSLPINNLTTTAKKTS